LHRIKKRLLLAIMFMYFPMSPGHTLNTYMQVPLLNLRVSLLLATFASMQLTVFNFTVRCIVFNVV
jgi:hypothetical protein